MEEEPVLYNVEGVQVYFSAKKVAEYFGQINDFRIYAESFEREQVSPENFLPSIEIIRKTIPEEIRKRIHGSFRVSEEELNNLEKRCEKRLKEERIEVEDDIPF